MTTEQSFLKDVATHQMTVLMDNGLYRHVRFKKPGSYDMHFDLVTYPGFLVYSGDMGCYVFSRLDDMFQFFRSDRLERDGKKLYINLGYWAEKLQAVDGNRRKGSAMEYCQDKMEAVIKEQRLTWIREREIDKEQRRELWEELDNLMADLNGDEGHDYHLVNNWDYTPFTGAVRSHGSARFYFQDLWDHNFQEYTHHFTWCCYALAWAIQVYDEAKQTKAIAA